MIELTRPQAKLSLLVSYDASFYYPRGEGGARRRGRAAVRVPELALGGGVDAILALLHASPRGHYPGGVARRGF